MKKPKKEEMVKFDRPTRHWFNTHWNAEATLSKCEKCGLFYKSDFEHKCEESK